MKLLKSLAAAGALAAAVPLSVSAQSYAFTFTAPGVSGSVSFNYGPATDAKYPSAFEITSIGGSFSDSNGALSIVNAPIVGLTPITRDTPEADNLLAPKDFSRFPVASGSDHGSLSFDNLFWPAGSPQTASDYPAKGGFLDIYGVLFSIGNGRVVNVWSNGTFGPPGSPIDYGVAVATAANSLDYVAGGVTVTAVPEPATYGLLLAGLGVLGFVAQRRKAS